MQGMVKTKRENMGTTTKKKKKKKKNVPEDIAGVDADLKVDVGLGAVGGLVVVGHRAHAHDPCRHRVRLAVKDHKRLLALRLDNEPAALPTDNSETGEAEG